MLTERLILDLPILALIKGYFSKNAALISRKIRLATLFALRLLLFDDKLADGATQPRILLFVSLLHLAWIIKSRLSDRRHGES